MYCQNCGNRLDANTAFCPRCGTQNGQPMTVEQDAPSGVFAILGFFFPLIGFILYLVYENKMPLRAKSAGKGALVGFIVGVVLIVAIVIITIVFSSVLFTSVLETVGGHYELWE